MKRISLFGLLIVALSISSASAQTCNTAVVTQSGSSMNIALAGCGVPPIVVPPIIVPPIVLPPVVVAPSDNIPNPSKHAFIKGPLHAGLNGAGVEINAWAQPPSRCNTTPPLRQSWQHNIDLNDYKSKNAFDFFALNTGESLSYKFTVGDADMSGGFAYGDAAASGADVRPTFMSITSAPCDFDLQKLQAGNTCYRTTISTAQITWHNLAAVPAGSYCKLVKGQTYYLNLRFQDGRTPAQGGPMAPEDSCNGGRQCGGLLQAM